MVDEDAVTLMVEEYTATDGREFFLSHEDPENDILVGFLRLRFPSEEAHRPEIDETTALVRELHVYGSMLPIGERGDAVGQHRGYGEELLARAESLAADNGMEKILVTSGIGAREYYSKFGYRREGPYMAKKL
jgi:Histone acetyltransferase